MPDTYRSAASILVLRPSPEGKGREPYQILLLHKPRKRDAWQLPQGGVEAGETIGTAACRELKEEAGVEDITLFGESDRIYQYDFPPSFRRFRPDDVCGQKISFVFALAPKDLQVSVDGKEVDRHLWVSLQELSLYIKRKEYLILIQIGRAHV